MMFFSKIFTIASFLFGMSYSAHSEDWVVITPDKQLHWQMAPDGIIYFRNLDQFNPSFLACCYNYSLNVTTDRGKAMWSTILAKTATKENIILGVANQKAPGPITYIGQW